MQLLTKALSSDKVTSLGFARSNDIQPDIFILDEVLSVGDESFKYKCQKRSDEFWKSHVMVLVVYHYHGFY
jgi:ABC-type polysaccharide/polyol phosphate transport system ATPase subunit